MPRRPPAEPRMPKTGATRAEFARYFKQRDAWIVGEVLREYAAARAVDPRAVPDEVALLPSPGFGPKGAPRLSGDGTPDQMGSLVRHLDRQAKAVAPMARAWEALRADVPEAARVAWARHVELRTWAEIARAQGISERTALRLLALANVRLMAALEGAAGTATGRRARVKLLDLAERREAAWRRGADGELDDDESAWVG